MIIPYHCFTEVVPKTCVMKAIYITGYNLKLIYAYLKEQGCTEFPPEDRAYGQIWVFDPDTKECIAYTEQEFKQIFVKGTSYEFTE